MMQQIEKYIDKFPVHVDRTHSFIIFSSNIMNQIIMMTNDCVTYTFETKNFLPIKSRSSLLLNFPAYDCP